MPSVINLKREKNQSDEELIQSFRSDGNLETLGVLFERYMHLVYGVCLKYLKNREEARDAVMQVFEKLITDIPKQEIKNFSSWLHVVTKNYCLMQLRSAKSEKARLDKWLADEQNYMENTHEMHPVDRDEANMEDALRDCIEKLKEEQKRCITEFYYENKCYREIALSMGLSEKKVKSYLQNGKRNLKLCLDKKNERPG